MRIIDLSLSIDDQMPGVSISPARRLETDGWNATTLSLYSHCGTHMDAPCHFLSQGATLDQQSLETLVGPARVIDVAPAAPRQSLTVADLGGLAETIAAGDRLLIDFVKMGRKQRATHWATTHFVKLYRPQEKHKLRSESHIGVSLSMRYAQGYHTHAPKCLV